MFHIVPVNVRSHNEEQAKARNSNESQKHCKLLYHHLSPSLGVGRRVPNRRCYSQGPTYVSMHTTVPHHATSICGALRDGVPAVLAYAF